MKTLVRSGLYSFAIAFGYSVVFVPQASAYPIDCAIILCMSGGFPASAECLAAKAEVIRRITPIPVEPPLKIWKCPMGIDPTVAAQLGLPANSGSDAYPPEVLNIQDGIETFDIKYTDRHTHDGEVVTEEVKQGIYVGTEYDWKNASYIRGPAWLAEATGGYRKDIYYSSGDRGMNRRKIGTVNAHNGSFRAVVMRYKDYEGHYQSQVVNY